MKERDELDEALNGLTDKEGSSKVVMDLEEEDDGSLEKMVKDLDVDIMSVATVREKPSRAKPVQTERPKAVAVIKPSKVAPAKKTTQPDFINTDLPWSAITQLPRGLPSWFTGREMDDIVNDLMNAEYREIEDEIHVKLGRDWYYGDPRRLGEYLQRIRK